MRGKFSSAVIVAMILAFMLTMAFSGCGAIKKMEGYLCNPTADEKVEAKQGLAFIQAALVLIKDVALQNKLAAAEDTFAMVQTGVCVLLTDLQTAIAAVDAAGAAQVTAPAGAAAPVMPTPPAMPNLRKWAKVT